MPKHVSIRKGHQIAAVPLRLAENGAMQVLLVTSRETRRWILPKGWPMKGIKDYRAAKIEAHEEAGVRGRVLSQPVGTYSYWRRTRCDFRLSEVRVYPLLVKRELKRWKEEGQRDRCWFSILDAADHVLEPELSTLIVRMPLDEALQGALTMRSSSVA
ncbi:NUDIX hydrolase [Antarcticirhabdus aurantiaca]|uniref:NUDIX hydrolase n=1 Tax=Antarcticirhabdus aurantiaca TaxID=2606717 RepID=A0ACD4NLV1_9HYPH|nr:NUDIX hydrolase [Antarcticirhabdus aurantiaca]WAJ27885.1 NUDIX hydrolase [Jeongeuplla avenae]